MNGCQADLSPEWELLQVELPAAQLVLCWSKVEMLGSWLVWIGHGSGSPNLIGPPPYFMVQVRGGMLLMLA